MADLNNIDKNETKITDGTYDLAINPDGSINIVGGSVPASIKLADGAGSGNLADVTSGKQLKVTLVGSAPGEIYIKSSDSSDQVDTDGSGHMKVSLNGSTAGQIEIKSGNSANKVNTDGSNRMKVTLAGAPAGNTIIESGDASGYKANVDSSGRLQISQQVQAPVGTTAISRTRFDGVSTTHDYLYTITNGKSLTITRFSGGCESSTNGSDIELYEDPNGDLSVLNIIDVIFVSGISGQHDLLATFIGNGTRRILMRRKRLDGGAKSMFGRWEGFEI